jgi:hypothetical protein
MATLTNSSPARQTVSLGSALKAALIGGGIAAVGNLILLLIAGLVSIPLNVMVGPPGPNAPVMPIGAVPVIIFSVLPAIIGGLLYFVLTKVSAKGSTIFIIIAVVVALLSLLPIFSQPLTAGGVIVLILMHLVAAGAITWALVTRARA